MFTGHIQSLPMYADNNSSIHTHKIINKNTHTHVAISNKSYHRFFNKYVIILK